MLSGSEYFLRTAVQRELELPETLFGSWLLLSLQSLVAVAFGLLVSLTLVTFISFTFALTTTLAPSGRVESRKGILTQCQYDQCQYELDSRMSTTDRAIICGLII